MAEKRIITNLAEAILDENISTEDLQKELDYHMALVFNDLLLEKGLISEEIHERAKYEFIDSYKPELAPPYALNPLL